jgi:hypothetical protein
LATQPPLRANKAPAPRAAAIEREGKEGELARARPQKAGKAVKRVPTGLSKRQRRARAASFITQHLEQNNQHLSETKKTIMNSESENVYGFGQSSKYSQILQRVCGAANNGQTVAVGFVG